MKNWMAAVVAVISVSAVAQAGQAIPEATPQYASVPATNSQTISLSEAIQEGVRAYRLGDFPTATALLTVGADAGEPKAQRYLGYMLIEGEAASAENLLGGVQLLKQAARAGDYAALIRLEDLRRKELAHSPTLKDMIEIETVRAESGDPVAAWRLAERYELGDGVVASEVDMVRWLEITAEAEKARFPKADEAAFRLCETFALGENTQNPDRARHWCAKAADNGHAGAAIVLRRLASL
ncbi:tetratricopeptide repeat protein [Hyphococcus lacteus]|uniref:Sel1 repeat family protein n=1 Tax=Hyphococcus lacteus TaxID=3143536 RepID=A0ABV3Z2F7_9PROT